MLENHLGTNNIVIKNTAHIEINLSNLLALGEFICKLLGGFNLIFFFPKHQISKSKKSSGCDNTCRYSNTIIKRTLEFSLKSPVTF